MQLRNAHVANSQYIALSYIWGPETRKSIMMSGFAYDIRENVWQALKHLRHQSQTIVLWADAICIDQQNITERNHQVAQMGTIYTLAQKVMAWLGIFPSGRWFPEVAIQSLQLDDSPSSNFNHHPTRMEALNSVSSLFQNEYWSRLWIVRDSIREEHLFSMGARQIFS
ncbi:heterokaryon incompatibility [Halenospora varia]|nr:heterokaryon incompatibility [Halenospora varia]